MSVFRLEAEKFIEKPVNELEQNVYQKSARLKTALGNFSKLALSEWIGWPDAAAVREAKGGGPPIPDLSGRLGETSPQEFF